MTEGGVRQGEGGGGLRTRSVDSVSSRYRSKHGDLFFCLFFHSWSPDGHCGRMSSWRIFSSLCLLVCVSAPWTTNTSYYSQLVSGWPLVSWQLFVPVLVCFYLLLFFCLPGFLLVFPVPLPTDADGSNLMYLRSVDGSDCFYIWQQMVTHSKYHDLCNATWWHDDCFFKADVGPVVRSTEPWEQNQWPVLTYANGLSTKTPVEGHSSCLEQRSYLMMIVMITWPDRWGAE